MGRSSLRNQRCALVMAEIRSLEGKGDGGRARCDGRATLARGLPPPPHPIKAWSLESGTRSLTSDVGLFGAFVPSNASVRRRLSSCAFRREICSRNML